jgi:hypothetical protein
VLGLLFHLDTQRSAIRVSSRGNRRTPTISTHSNSAKARLLPITINQPHSVTSSSERKSELQSQGGFTHTAFGVPNS